MKKKIIGIMIVTLLIVTAVLPAIGIENSSYVDIKTFFNGTDTISIDDNVPVWEVGDKWIYEVKHFGFDFEGQTSMNIHLEADDLTLEVVDVNEDSYRLEFKTQLAGDIGIELSFIPIVIEGKLGRILATKIDGEVSIRKSDLAIEEISIKASGILKAKISLQSIPFPILNAPLPFETSLNTNFDNPITIFDFPLSVEKMWSWPSMNVSVDGEIKSIWLNIVYFVNKIAEFLNMGFIPSRLAKLLPVIDIGDTLEEYVGGNLFEINSSFWYDLPLFGVASKEDINVKAGTYSAYNITIPGGLGSYYYSPETGNIIKIALSKKQSLFPVFPELNMELKETNYI